MIRGLLHGIKRFWSRCVLTRRPSCHRKRGGFMGRAGVDLFIEDGAYTTLSSAVVILVVLTLLFSSTAAIWSMSRAGDTQVAADSGALAGANVVSSYHTAATVVDASILSLGLAGFATIGTGLVAILIPGAEPVAGNMVDTGIEIIKTRNKFAKSASEGLQKIETALPYLIAARATQAVSAQDTDSVAYTGTALAVPRTSESDFAALKGSEISTDTIKDTSDDLERAAEELRKASEDTAKAKERAWLADCGGSVPASVGSCSCMWERARSLAKLSGEQNPHYASSISWEPQVALDRAKAYYRSRLANEAPQGSSVETKAESAARKAFYTYASTEVNRAYVTEDGDEVASYIPLLPRNTDEVRATELYTDTVWPTSAIDGKTYLHYGTSCPNYKKGRHAGWPRLLLMTGRTNAIDAILVFRRSVPLRLLRLLSKTALSTTLIDSKRLWKTTSNAATKNSNLSVRPRMRPTARAMRLTRPLKRFPASARVSPHLAVTAWSPLQFRVTLPAPINLTPRLTRQSGLAIAVLSLPRCRRPMRRRRKTTCFRDFSRH